MSTAPLRCPVKTFLSLPIILAAALTAGCATCREHPVGCGAAVAIVAGSIAAAVSNHGGSNSPGCAPLAPPYTAVLGQPCP